MEQAHPFTHKEGGMRRNETLRVHVVCSKGKGDVCVMDIPHVISGLNVIPKAVGIAKMQW
jgi:hypothetical protein